MKSVLIGSALALLLASTPTGGASAQQSGPPEWMKQTQPAVALPGVWEEFQAMNGPKGALDAKTKELIGLAVAAQIPCQYCVYGHTLGAKHAGATDEQIKEAIAVAGMVRNLSTGMNGSAYDFAKFKAEVDAFYAGH